MHIVFMCNDLYNNKQLFFLNSINPLKPEIH